jgi:hypothetical protein
MIPLTPLKTASFLRLYHVTYATGDQGIGIRTLDFISWINGTVLCTVSPQPSTPQLFSRVTFRSSKSANCQRWWTVFSSPIWTNQAPTPSMTSRRAFRPLRQCVSHSKRFPGCRVYDLSSKRPPNCLGAVVGQKENSCMRETFLDVISDLSFLSNAGNSG